MLFYSISRKKLWKYRCARRASLEYEVEEELTEGEKGRSYVTYYDLCIVRATMEMIHQRYLVIHRRLDLHRTNRWRRSCPRTTCRLFLLTLQRLHTQRSQGSASIRLQGTNDVPSLTYPVPVVCRTPMKWEACPEEEFRPKKVTTAQCTESTTMYCYLRSKFL